MLWAASLTSKQHQTGQLVGNDAAPEFNAKILPAGSAPPSRTFQPNPVEDDQSQANNPDTQAPKASDTIIGATSGDVHTGLGKPVQGQSSSDQGRDGKGQGQQAEGGSGLTGAGSAEARGLQSSHQEGAKTSREHNVSLDGAETKEGVGAEEVSAMGQGSRKEDYDRSSYTAKGGPNA